ncbi:hypothetical protein, partial [Hydrogenophaga sp.]|uniref:hypothetical protein n=1 Tax=Hydrogenophaga sp. TaxID=1904254 RepID=UPI003568BC66
LRAPQATSLSSLMRSPGAVLMAHAALAGTASHPGWEQASALPVVEPGERLVGVMTRDALARALRRSLPMPLADAAVSTLPAVLVRGYWQTLSGMVGVGLGLLPSVPPVLGAAPQREQEHDGNGHGH